MNQKLIAAAVAAVVVAPVASYGDVTVYGNITNALVSEDNGTVSTTDVSTVGSRLGVKASSDLGNGLSANGQYEFATQSDNADEAFGTTRIATVGLSGSFGSFNVGQQWSSFYNTIGSMVSPNYTVGVPLGGPARTSNTLKYNNNFGPVSLGIDLRVDDDADGIADDNQDGFYDRDGQGDGFGIGVTFNPTSNLTIGIAYDDADGQTAIEERALDEGDFNIFGIAAKATFGNSWVSAGYQSAEREKPSTIPAVDVDGNGDFDDVGDLAAVEGDEIETDYYQLWVGTTVGEQTALTLGYGESDVDATDAETDRLAFAVNHDMGGGLHLFFEYQDGTATNAAGEDTDADKTFVGMRINF